MREADDTGVGPPRGAAVTTSAGAAATSGLTGLGRRGRSRGRRGERLVPPAARSRGGGSRPLGPRRPAAAGRQPRHRPGGAGHEPARQSRSRPAPPDPRCRARRRRDRGDRGPRCRRRPTGGGSGGGGVRHQALHLRLVPHQDRAVPRLPGPAGQPPGRPGSVRRRRDDRHPAAGLELPGPAQGPFGRDARSDHRRAPARGSAERWRGADEIGISRVTARRYLEYLADAALAERRTSHEGRAGRPEVRYRWR